MKTFKYEYKQAFENLRKTSNFFSLFPALVLASSVCTATPALELIKDIKPGSSASNIFEMRSGSERIFFIADDGTSGQEVWTSDGTTTGTVKVTDTAAPYLPYADTANETVNNTYFFENRGDSGEYELWRSGGTPAETFRLLTLPDAIITHGITDELYYFVPMSDDTYGSELWKSDGTIAGTGLVKDIYSGWTGNGSSSPTLLTSVNNTLFFTAIDDTHGRELWKTDGTEAGTAIVADIKEGNNSSDIRYMLDVAGTLYFKNTNLLNGSELWKHEPASGQTVKVKDMQGMTDIGSVYAAVDDTLFFQGNDDNYGSELWKSDGSEEGTVLVRDINAGSDRSSPESLTNVAGTLFFSAFDEIHGRELWKSDGTSAGTVMVKEITDAEESTQLRCLTAVDDTLFFFVQTNFHISSLWISDGTEEGTIDTNMQVNPGTCPVSMNGQLYLYGWEGMEYGSELYRYNLSDNVPVSPVATVSIEGTKVTLTWNSVPGAEGYNLVYAPYPYTGPETIGSFDLGNTTSLSVDLWQGAAFYVALEAYDSDSVSEYSNIELFILE